MAVQTGVMASGSHLHSLVSWRAVLAGVFVSFLTYAILFFLGLAVGGISLDNVIREGGITELGVGAGVWIILSTVISLLAGSYFAARISNYVTRRIGAAQGLVIAGLFFSIMFAEMVITAGAAGLGFTTVAGISAAKEGRSTLTKSVVEASLDEIQLTADFETVAKGVTSRLLRGDTDSARAFLASQTNTPEGVDQAINDINTGLEEVASNTARAMSGLSWLAFLTLLLGAGGSGWGGAMGSNTNHKKPLDADEVIHISRSQNF